MIKRSLVSMFLAVGILIAAGCSIESVTQTTAVGDTITNEWGKGTGTVAGINITIEGLNQKNAAISHAVHATQGVHGSSESHQWDVDLGEVNMVLSRENGQPIALTVDGASYGNVSKGDELLIDANRLVFVNGEKRTAQ